MEQLQTFPCPDLDLKGVTTVVAIAVLVLVVYIDAVRKRKKNGSRLPPGPRPWPIIGNLGNLGVLLHQDFAKLAKQYGPLMLLRLGSVTTIVVSSPHFAELFLKTHDKVFASRPNTTPGKLLCYDNQIIGLAPYGPSWRHKRKVFTLELLTARRTQQFQSVRTEEVLNTLHSILDECKAGKAAHMDIKFGHLAKNNMARMMINKSHFGPNSSATLLAERTMYSTAFKETVKYLGFFVLGDYIPFLQNFDVQRCKKKMQAIGRTMDEMFTAIIKEHRQKLVSPSELPDGNSDGMDIVDVLLSRPKGVDEKHFNDTQIKAILENILLAGTDTSSNTLEWTMAELLRNPLIMKRAQDELDEVIGRDRLVEESDIPHLHYLEAVVKESFRLHPVVPLLLPRESMEACEVGGYYIPIKSRVFINIWAIGRDPAVWDRPLEFYPDRFLTSKKDVDVVGQDFELLPFGAGRRNCPGRQLGLLLVQYTLAVLLHACDWSLPEGLRPKDMDVNEAPGITNPMATPLQAVATPRLSPSVIYANKGKVENRDVHLVHPLSL